MLLPFIPKSTLRTRFFQRDGSNDRPPILHVYVRRGKKGSQRELEGNWKIAELAKEGEESASVELARERGESVSAELNERGK